MKLTRKCLLTFVILGLITKGFSQDNKDMLKLSISEAQNYALQYNRSVQSAKIDVKSMEKKIWENLATGFPQLNFDINYQHQFVVPELSLGPYLDVNALPDGFLTKQNILDHYPNSPPFALGVKNNAIINLTLSQLIFSGQYFIGVKAVQIAKQVTEKALVKTEAQTKESVADTYYLILVLSENDRVLNESLKSVNQTYGEMVKMNQQGLNEETDVDQIKINSSNIQTLINSVESQKEISMKLLKFQLGVDFNQPLELTDSLRGIIEKGNIQYMSPPEYNAKNSVDYQIMSNQEKVASLLLKMEQSKYLPTVTSFYRHQEQTNQPSFNFAVKDIVGVTLSLPIISSGQRNSKISQAKFDLEKSRLNKENGEQGLMMDFETALSSYQTAFSNFTTNKESMTLSKKVYEKTVIKYREGVSSSFELTQNQNQFLTAESNYYNSVLSLLNAKAKLDRILSSDK
jgi:outer membrane protein TolC